MFNQLRWKSQVRNGMVVLAVLSALSCVQKKSGEPDPQETLKKYIEQSFKIEKPSDRETLERFLTGDALDRLKSWTDEQFIAAFIRVKRSNPKLKIRESRANSANETSITYEISYSDERGDQKSRVTNRKLCQLVEASGQWFIKDCKNIKQLVEYQNEMDLP